MKICPAVLATMHGDHEKICAVGTLGFERGVHYSRKERFR